ncbi:uncharacterized protein LOC121043737 [Herpailurus yagouaroundi]|uniref:uncharacterized protein LOC121043737 n=1 Tax=Herpailurus yagouaroundi TaxID=1608482 RepID=UPI001AD60D4F|nr:uncharacterized protein LOC121043737 [Puma yagouaroundi]
MRPRDCPNWRYSCTPPPPPPAPWRRRRTSFRPLPAGAAGVIQQGRGGSPCRGSRAGGSQLPESARSLRPVLAHKCEIGQHLTPSSPWCFCLYPLPRFSVQSRPLARQRHVQCLRDAHSAVDFRTKNLLPGVATPLNCRFPPPTRSPRKVGSQESQADETGQTSVKGKGAHPCHPVRGASFTRGLSPSPFSGILRVSSSLSSLCEPRPRESRGEPGAGRVAPPGCDHARLRKAAVLWPFLTSCQMTSVSRRSLGSVFFHSH